MGHIAPKTARQMVSKGAIRGIEIDSVRKSSTATPVNMQKQLKNPSRKSIKAPEQKNLVMKSTLPYGDLHLFKPLATKALQMIIQDGHTYNC